MSETPTTETPAPKQPSLALLASEEFGREFYGEVSPEETPTEPVQIESDDSALELKTEIEAKPAEDEEVPISSLDELVAKNEWDPEWVNALEIPVKIDGEAGKAKLSDLVASYQTQEAATKRLNDVKEKAKAQNQQLAEKNEQLNAQFAVVANLLQQSEKMLEQDVSNIDWVKLREQDPAEYTAKRQDMLERKAAIERLKSGAVSEYQKYTGMTKAEQEQSKQAMLQEENSKLLKIFPAWSDVKVRETETAKVSKYLLDQGLTREEIAETSDHRLVNLAYKAMLYDEGMSKVDTAKKKVVKVPKMMKPGTTKPQDQINREKYQERLAKLRKSGSLDDAMELLKLGKG